MRAQILGFNSFLLGDTDDNFQEKCKLSLWFVSVAIQCAALRWRCVEGSSAKQRNRQQRNSSSAVTQWVVRKDNTGAHVVLVFDQPMDGFTAAPALVVFLLYGLVLLLLLLMMYSHVNACQWQKTAKVN